MVSMQNNTAREDQLLALLQENRIRYRFISSFNNPYYNGGGRGPQVNELLLVANTKYVETR